MDYYSKSLEKFDEFYQPVPIEESKFEKYNKKIVTSERNWLLKKIIQSYK
jgi:hypothetical protein